MMNLFENLQMMKEANTNINISNITLSQGLDFERDFDPDEREVMTDDIKNIILSKAKILQDLYNTKIIPRLTDDEYILTHKDEFDVYGEYEIEDDDEWANRCEDESENIKEDYVSNLFMNHISDYIGDPFEMLGDWLTGDWDNNNGVYAYCEEYVNEYLDPMMGTNSYQLFIACLNENIKKLSELSTISKSFFNYKKHNNRDKEYALNNFIWDGESEPPHHKDINIIIQNGVTEIGKQAFKHYDRIKSIEIPDSVTKIGEDAFYMCQDLKIVKIPNSVTEIGEGAFYVCTGLQLVTLPNSITKIENWTFTACHSLKSIEIPNSVIEIGKGAFEKCYSLKSIEILNKNCKFGKDVFEECNSLESIKIGDKTMTLDEFNEKYNQ